MTAAAERSPTFADFNPTKDPRVDEIKVCTDELIALCDRLSSEANEDGKRRFALAKTEYEVAAMWAVKGCFS